MHNPCIRGAGLFFVSANGILFYEQFLQNVCNCHSPLFTESCVSQFWYLMKYFNRWCYVNRHSGSASHHPHSFFSCGADSLHFLGGQEGLRLQLHLPVPLHLPPRAPGVHHHPGPLHVFLPLFLSIDPC